MNRKRLSLLFLTTALLLLVLIPCGLTWQKVRQARLDRTLIQLLQWDGMKASDAPKEALIALNQGADPNAFENDEPPLSAWQQLLKIVHHTPIRMRKPGYHHGERCALVLAVAHDEWAVAKVLLQRGATDVNGKVYLSDGIGGEEFSLLGEAIQDRDEAGTIHGNDEVARMLLERGANPNIEENRGGRPLGAAIVANNLPMLEELVRHGADVNLGGYRSVPPLIQGAGCSSPVVLRFLLEHGADPNAQYLLGPDDYREFETTALAEARKRKDGHRDETICLLKQFGAKR